jgi:peroxiredoxin Q/BCP
MYAKVGKKAPEVAQPSNDRRSEVSLENLWRKRPVVLFFYPKDCSSACTDQMDQVQQEIERLEEKGAKRLAVGVNSPWSHEAGAEEQEIINLPLLSDFQREVVEEYEVKYRPGLPQRVCLVIDSEDVVVPVEKIEAYTRDQSAIVEALEDLEKAL